MIVLGLVSLLVVFNNVVLFDVIMPTAFGVKSGPIYFGGMSIDIGIGIVIYGEVFPILRKRSKEKDVTIMCYIFFKL